MKQNFKNYTFNNMTKAECIGYLKGVIKQVRDAYQATKSDLFHKELTALVIAKLVIEDLKEED